MKADFKSNPISTGKGIQLYIGEKHVKTIAKKYSLVWDCDFIENTKYKRPTDLELESLNKFLVDKKGELKKAKRVEKERVALGFFLSDLARTEPLVFELVKKAKPIEARPLKNYFSETWKELVFDNKVRLKIPNNLYKKLDSIRSEKTVFTN